MVHILRLTFSPKLQSCDFHLILTTTPMEKQLACCIPTSNCVVFCFATFSSTFAFFLLLKLITQYPILPWRMFFFVNNVTDTSIENASTVFMGHGPEFNLYGRWTSWSTVSRNLVKTLKGELQTNVDLFR